MLWPACRLRVQTKTNDTLRVGGGDGCACGGCGDAEVLVTAALMLAAAAEMPVTGVAGAACCTAGGAWQRLLACLSPWHMLQGRRHLAGVVLPATPPDAVLRCTLRPSATSAGLLLRELGRESSDVLAAHASQVAAPAYMAQASSAVRHFCCCACGRRCRCCSGLGKQAGSPKRGRTVARGYDTTEGGGQRRQPEEDCNPAARHCWMLWGLADACAHSCWLLRWGQSVGDCQVIPWWHSSPSFYPCTPHPAPAWLPA